MLGDTCMLVCALVLSYALYAWQFTSLRTRGSSEFFAYSTFILVALGMSVLMWFLLGAYSQQGVRQTKAFALSILLSIAVVSLFLPIPLSRIFVLPFEDIFALYFAGSWFVLELIF